MTCRPSLLVLAFLGACAVAFAPVPIYKEPKPMKGLLNQLRGEWITPILRDEGESGALRHHADYESNTSRLPLIG